MTQKTNKHKKRKKKQIMSYQTYILQLSWSMLHASNSKDEIVKGIVSDTSKVAELYRGFQLLFW